MAVIQYCCGFFFDPPQACVWLVRKLRPEWQAGRLNGIGGKVEEGEWSRLAMVREFEEEAGVTVPEERWRTLISLNERRATWRVDFFTAVATDTDEFGRVRAMTDEPLEAWPVCDLWHCPDILPGLRYQLAVALDDSGLVLPVLLDDHGIGARR